MESPADRACQLMVERRTRELGCAGRKRLQYFFLALFAIHRSFSANCFRAKNSRDFTVPTGTLSIAETSSSV